MDGRCSPPDKEISHGNPDGFSGNLPRYAGERPCRTAFSGYEDWLYRGAFPLMCVSEGELLP